MGLFGGKTKKEKTSETKPHPLTVEWAREVHPVLSRYLTGVEPWLLGEPTEAERLARERGETVWQTMLGYPEMIEGLREYAMGIRPEDYSGQYISALQKSLGTALDEAMKKASSQAAARGIMYGTPTQEIVARAMEPVLTGHEREMARALQEATRYQLAAEQLRAGLLEPYYKMKAQYPAMMADVYKVLTPFAFLPEEQRRDFFLNLMRVMGTLSPISTGWTMYKTPGIFDYLTALAGAIGEAAPALAAAV
ncbi:MAG: hypothetical protein DRG20_00940 [Deltaproteobacteria bacterium]|nr:MAG: hypothetical protein DRG20_00940 [Deltaproteobacteria bacterium]